MRISDWSSDVCSSDLRWPHSLEAVAARLDPDAVFPCSMSLGRGFPVPWIAWIPDFQHRLLPHLFSEAARRYRDTAYRRLAAQAPHIVVSSRDAYADLMRYFPTEPARRSEEHTSDIQ